MNYNLTISELFEHITKELECLKGRNPLKEGGIAKMVEKALTNMKIQGDFIFWENNIEVEDCQLKQWVSSFDENVPFAVFHATYKEDKRKCSGIGDYIESVSVELIRELPMDLEVANISQTLSYEVAKERFEQFEKEQLELQKTYSENMAEMRKLRDIMKCDAYSNATANHVVLNVDDTLRRLSSWGR